jgi:hypothetical protein
MCPPGPVPDNVPLAYSQLGARLTFYLGGPTCLTGVGDAWSSWGRGRLGWSFSCIHTVGLVQYPPENKARYPVYA